MTSAVYKGVGYASPGSRVIRYYVIMYSTGADTFYKYYQQQKQSGGALAHIGGIPVFRGARRQRGAGLGDILRSAFRWFLPVAKRGALTFAKSMIQNLDQGASFRDAAKQSLKPTLNVAAEAIKEKFANKQQQQLANGQSGSGRGRRKAKKRACTQTGGRRRVYKAAKKRRIAHRQTGSGAAKKRKQQSGGSRRRKTRKTVGAVKKRKQQARRTRHDSVDSATYYNF